MNNSIDDLIDCYKSATKREEYIDLFNNIVESYKYNINKSIDRNVESFVFKLVVIIFILLMFLSYADDKYTLLWTIESFALFCFWAIAVNHAKQKKYISDAKEKYLKLFEFLYQDKCVWSDFKSHLVIEHEIYINKNPLLYRNIDKIIFASLTLSILKYYFKPKKILVEFMGLIEYQWLVAGLLIIPFSFFLYKMSNFSKLDKIKSLLKLVSKFDSKRAS